MSGSDAVAWRLSEERVTWSKSTSRIFETPLRIAAVHNIVEKVDTEKKVLTTIL